MASSHPGTSLDKPPGKSHYHAVIAELPRHYASLDVPSGEVFHVAHS